MSVESALDYLASEDGQKLMKKYKRDKQRKERNTFLKDCAKEIILPLITSVLTTIVLNLFM